MQVIQECAEELGLTYPMLLKLVEMEQTPCVLRAECCRLLCVLYVDVEPHRAVPSITKVRTWSALMQSPHPRSAPQLPGMSSPPAVWTEAEAELRFDATGLKDMLAREVKLLSKPPAEGTPMAKIYFREDSFGGVVHVITQLLRFGFYHKTDEGTGGGSNSMVAYWHSVDLDAVKGIANDLFEGMDTWLDALLGDAKAGLAARRHEIAVCNAKAVLNLMTRLVQHGINHQVGWRECAMLCADAKEP